MAYLLPTAKAGGVAITALVVVLVAAKVAIDAIYFPNGGDPEESDLAAAIADHT